MEKGNLKLKLCTAAFLYNNIQNYRDKILTIDTRPDKYFEEMSIKNSISLTPEKVHKICDKTCDQSADFSINELESMLTCEESLKFSQRRRQFCFIIISQNNFSKTFTERIFEIAGTDPCFDDCFEVDKDIILQFLTRYEQNNSQEIEYQSIYNGLSISEALLKDKARETYILFEGACSLFSSYPVLNNVNLNYFKNSLKLPNDILNKRLFLGCYNVAGELQVIRNLKVTHIVNVTSECNNDHENEGIKYLKIDIFDEDDKQIYKYFQTAYDFIKNALDENSENVILVHCAQGKSRSATIVMMFLMKKFAWDFEKAYEYVKRKREVINPNYGFIKQLRDFESNNFSFVQA